MNSLDKFVFQLACKLEHTLSTTCYIQKPFSDTDAMRVINLGNNYSIGVIKIQSLLSVSLIKSELQKPVLIPSTASQSEIELIEAINRTCKDEEIGCVKVRMNLNGMVVASEYIENYIENYIIINYIIADYLIIIST